MELQNFLPCSIQKKAVANFDRFSDENDDGDTQIRINEQWGLPGNPHWIKQELLRFAVFHFAHSFQLFGDIAALFGELGIFDDVIVNAIFIVTFHAGDDALDCFNAHPWLDVIAQVVQQQDALLVVTDLFSTSWISRCSLFLRRNRRTNSSTSWNEGLVVSIFIPLIMWESDSFKQPLFVRANITHSCRRWQCFYPFSLSYPLSLLNRSSSKMILKFRNYLRKARQIRFDSNSSWCAVSMFSHT